MCASTPPQFVEMLRVARFLREGTEFDAVLWLQLLPHKLAEAIAICEDEGFPYFARPLGEAPAPAVPIAVPEVPPPARVVPIPAPPFVIEAIVGVWRAPLARGRWVTLGAALLGRGRLRMGRVRRQVRRVVGDHLRAPLQKVVTRSGLRRPWSLRRRMRRILFRAFSVVGGRTLASAEACGFRGLPRPLRPLALPLFTLLFYLSGDWRLRTLVSLFDHYRRLGRSARETLALTGPDLVVVPEDALYDYASIVGKAARKGIPTVVVPYTIATAAEPAEAITHDPGFAEGYSLQHWSGRLVARLLPHWVYTYRGEPMLRYPACLVIVYEALGLAPRRPWVFNDGFSVALAAESEHMAALYRQEGLSTSYVVLTGALYDDVAAKARSQGAAARAELLEELGLSPRGTIALCALPPKMELERRLGCEFTSHEQIVETMLRPLLDLPDCAVVVSLHPTLRLADLRYLEAHGARISTRGIADLIARCDLYVAVISATIRIAIADGVPVVNYDVFRYGYHDYEAAEGVVTVQDRADYIEVIRRFGDEPLFREELRRRQQRVAARWGFRDGRSGAALLGLFRHLIACGSPRAYVSPRAGRDDRG